MAFAMDMTWAGVWLIGRFAGGASANGDTASWTRVYKAPDFSIRGHSVPDRRYDCPSPPEGRSGLLRSAHHPARSAALCPYFHEIQLAVRMSHPRFHCPFALSPRQRIELPDELAHHAVRVLRLRDGSPIVLFDGNGGQFPATLQIEGRRAWAITEDRQPVECELPVRVEIAQGIASGDKMDWIIEKAVEMGAARVTPIAARRSVIQLTGERREKRLRHWQRIAVAASEQCGRNRIMEVAPPQPLAEWLAGTAASGVLRLACHPGADVSLEDAVAAHAGPLALMVGPEGGWADEELDLMRQSGVSAVRFGKRVLRTETAGIALMAALAAIRRWE